MENGNSPATKQDVIEAVKASEDHLTQVMHITIKESEDRMTQVMQIAIKQSEERVTERMTEMMRDMQTEMLKAFYSIIESNQKRFTQIENESAAIKSRLATIEDRLIELERKVNTPKPPQQ